VGTPIHNLKLGAWRRDLEDPASQRDTDFRAFAWKMHMALGTDPRQRSTPSAHLTFGTWEDVEQSISLNTEQVVK